MSSPDVPSRDAPILIEGPRWYRTRLRTFGPLAAIGPPLIWGALSWLMLGAFSDRATSVIGLIGVLSSAPVLLLLGAPIGNQDLYPLAVATSVAVWAIVGWWAARRATRVSVAGWPEFWREYIWIAVGVWGGVLVAFGAVSMMYGDAFL